MKMVQTCWLFYLTVSVLLLLQSKDADGNSGDVGETASPKRPRRRPYESLRQWRTRNNIAKKALPKSPISRPKEKGSNSPFLRNIEKIQQSKAVKKTMEELQKLSVQFKDQVNEEYHENRDKKSILPDVIKHNVIQPSTALGKVLADRVAKDLINDYKTSYNQYNNGEKKYPGVAGLTKAASMTAALGSVGKARSGDALNKFLKIKRDQSEK